MIIIKKQEPVIEKDQKKISKKEKPKAFTHRKENKKGGYSSYKSYSKTDRNNRDKKERKFKRKY